MMDVLSLLYSICPASTSSSIFQSLLSTVVQALPANLVCYLHNLIFHLPTRQHFHNEIKKRLLTVSRLESSKMHLLRQYNISKYFAFRHKAPKYREVWFLLFSALRLLTLPVVFGHFALLLQANSGSHGCSHCLLECTSVMI